jgi:hypothetical protein
MKILPIRVRKESLDTIPEHHLWCLQQIFAMKQLSYKPETFIHVGINLNIANLSKNDKSYVLKALEVIPPIQRPTTEERIDSNLTIRFVAHSTDHLRQIWNNFMDSLNSNANDIELEFVCNDEDLEPTFPRGVARRSSSLSLSFSSPRSRSKSVSSSPRLGESPRSASLTNGKFSPPPLMDYFPKPKLGE